VLYNKTYLKSFILKSILFIVATSKIQKQDNIYSKQNTFIVLVLYNNKQNTKKQDNIYSKQNTFIVLVLYNNKQNTKKQDNIYSKQNTFIVLVLYNNNILRSLLF
jgi:hypothetical protein